MKEKHIKNTILLLIYIIIITRILQQLYVRIDVAQMKQEEVALQQQIDFESGMFEKSKIDQLLLGSKHYTDDIYEKLPQLPILVTSNQVTTSDNDIFFDKRLNYSEKEIIPEILSSLDVWKTFLQGGRSYLLGMIESGFHSVFDLNTSNVLLSMLLGNKQLYNSNTYHLFKVTGTQHLLVISGLHLSFITSFFSQIYSGGLPKKPVVLLNILIATLYFCLVGFSFSLLRAFLMYCIAQSSSFLNRQKRALHSALISFLILLLIDISFFSSISLQLSFLAVGGIILYSITFRQANTLFDTYLSQDTLSTKKNNFSLAKKYLIRYIFESILVSLVVQVVILPLVAYHFKEISLLSLVTTTLISWSIPVILQYGVFLAFAVFFFPTQILFIFSLPLSWLIGLDIFSLELFDVSWSLLSTPQVNISFLFYYYGAFALIYGLFSIFRLLNKKNAYEKIYSLLF